MAYVSIGFWVVGFILSVVMAPQLRIWTWGPTMACFSVATLAAIPPIWRQRGTKIDLAVILSGFVLVGYLAARAFLTPAAELGRSDFLLVAMAVATFLSFRAASGSLGTQRMLLGGITLLTVASLFVIAKQLVNPTFSPVFPVKEVMAPTGFFAHYSYGATFLVGVMALFSAFALHSGEKLWLRLAFSVLAILAIAGIYFSRSRGAIFGGVGVFGAVAVASLIQAKRSSSRWFSIGIIILPLLAILGVAMLYYSWIAAQAARNDVEQITGMFDNSIRLYLLGIAWSCIGLHPILGGGARSFSWECFQFWDVATMGEGYHKPEHVHNELIQTFTDYGILGGGLLVIFLSIVLISSLLRLGSEKKSGVTRNHDAWKIAGLAGFTGIFFQSNFEGILRIPPGTILLAMCIAFASIQPPRHQVPQTGRSWFRSGLLTIVGIAVFLSLAFDGYRGTRVSIDLWQSFFSKQKFGPESQIYATSKAIQHWPLFSLYQHRGILYQEAAAEETDRETIKEFLRLSLSDFREASRLHPFDPTSALGTALPLTLLERYAEADQHYLRAIELQGGMEAGFQGHLRFAGHLNKKGLWEYSSDLKSEAMVSFELAARHIEDAFTLSWRKTEDDHRLRVAIYENWARTLEDVKDYQKALDLYENASKLRFGGTSNYRAGLLYGKLAVESWTERKGSEALKLFQVAKQKIAIANELPADVSPENKSEWVAYIDQSIGYLEVAEFKPSEEVILPD